MGYKKKFFNEFAQLFDQLKILIYIQEQKIDKFLNEEILPIVRESLSKQFLTYVQKLNKKIDLELESIEEKNFFKIGINT